MDANSQDTLETWEVLIFLLIVLSSQTSPHLPFLHALISTPTPSYADFYVFHFLL